MQLIIKSILRLLFLVKKKRNVKRKLSISKTLSLTGRRVAELWQKVIGFLCQNLEVRMEQEQQQKAKGYKNLT